MVLSGWSAEQVIFQRWQYLAWEQDAMAPGWSLRDRWLLCAAMGAFPKHPECMESLVNVNDWQRIWEIAKDAYHGYNVPEICKAVTNYDNPRFWASGEPPWAEDMEFVGCVGRHCFYCPRKVPQNFGSKGMS